MQVAKLIARLIMWEASSGILLILVTALALLLANSTASAAYLNFVNLSIFSQPLVFWVNDLLMAVFFLLVGLEIKREFLRGELASRAQVVLPAVAACGGMLAPALIYCGVNRVDPDALRGWAIPSATDIAFTLGILSLFASRVPPALRVFLTTVAVLDDLGAIVIISLFYSSGLNLPVLAMAALLCAALFTLGRYSAHPTGRAVGALFVIGFLIWLALLKAGIHPTLAGVLLGLAMPDRSTTGNSTPLERVERCIHPWVSFAILPLFAFCNAGVVLNGIRPVDMLSPIPLGIAAGLFFGKQFGVFLSCVLLIRFKLATLPARCNWFHIYAASILCGIGFTMSLFIGLLAFPTPELQALTKLGVLSGSLISAVVGVVATALALRAYEAKR